MSNGVFGAWDRVVDVRFHERRVQRLLVCCFEGRFEFDELLELELVVAMMAIGLVYCHDISWRDPCLGGDRIRVFTRTTEQTKS